MSVRDELGRIAGDVLQAAWVQAQRLGTMGPRSRRARHFAAFGAGSAICFPITALYGERHIVIGKGTVIGPNLSLSAGVSPEQDLGAEVLVRIGDRCLIGRGSGIVAHESIVVESWRVDSVVADTIRRPSADTASSHPPVDTAGRPHRSLMPDTARRKNEGHHPSAALADATVIAV